MDNFKDAFEDLIKDMYNAEKQLIKALPKMAKAAQSEQLKAGFTEHLAQTEEHARRLEQVAETCGFKPTGKVCPAMKGLVEEADEHIKEGKPSPLKDAVLIAAAQKVEHYEMANYGTARAWAELISQPKCAQLLQETLREEEMADEKLNMLAEGGINQQACKTVISQTAKRKTAEGRGSARSKPAATRARSKAAAAR